MPRPVRALLLVLGMLGLLSGMSAGLVRMGWSLGAAVSLAGLHGPLMVMVFFGTVIPLERAVALDDAWTYLVPALSGVGGLLLLAGQPMWAAACFLLGAIGLVALFFVIAKRDPGAYVAVMALGAAVLVIANARWLMGAAVPAVVWGWAGFLVLTIVGERQELSRMRRLPVGVDRALKGLVVGLLGSQLWILYDTDQGVRAFGLFCFLQALWLLYYDLARRTMRTRGLPRFSGVSLWVGFLWLAVSGLMLLGWGALQAGFLYDAMLHALFVGFIFSMIFGHAPIIFPALLRLRAKFESGLWWPLALLHLSLVARIASDFLASMPGRQWAGMLNVAAIVWFLALTVRSLVRGLQRTQASAKA